jgi:pyruvate dehydrogenase E2 component (dihydrolipoamide acetyltransferase)
MGYYRRLKDSTSFRTLAAATWRAPNDPHIFGSVDVEMSAAQELIRRYNAHYDCSLTVADLVVRALALALMRYPYANAKVGWSRILVRSRVDIFCQVETDGGLDPSGFKIEGTDRLCLAELSEALRGAADKGRRDEDPAFRRRRGLFGTLPLWSVRLILRSISLLTNVLNLHLPRLGMPRDPYGSAMVTSVGGSGIGSGYVPFTPLSRCPIIIAIMRMRQRPWVVGDRVEPRPVLRLCGTFDHRVIDSFLAAAISSYVEGLLSKPERLLTPEERIQLDYEVESWPTDTEVDSGPA